MMELNPTITIDFVDFVKTGRFDGLRIGQTKASIFEFFALSDSAYDDPIWCYGNIELHFRRNMLAMILCENLGETLGNEGLKIEHWFFDDFDNSLLAVMEVLTKYNINYKVKYHKLYPYQCDVEITNSGVFLGFVDHEKRGNNQHNFHLQSFSYSKLHLL